MAEILDWERMRDMSARLLEERTGQGVADWNERIRKARPKDEAALRKWLTKQGVIGYAQSLLVMETFGYPDFMRATAKELIDGQYADRPHLRPILDAVLQAAEALGDVTIQARKTYISLVSGLRTFARIQPTKDHVAIALRLKSPKPGGRLRPSRIHESMRVQVELSSVKDLDADAKRWLRRAYVENR